MRWIHRILVPVDFSPASLAAYRYARFLAENVGATVDVLHAIPRQRMGEISGPAGWGDTGGALRRAPLCDAVRAFLGAGDDVDVIVTRADATIATVAASRWRYDVVVVGGAAGRQVHEDARCRVVTVWPPPPGSPIPFALEPSSRWPESRACGTAAGEAARVAG